MDRNSQDDVDEALRNESGQLPYVSVTGRKAFFDHFGNHAMQTLVAVVIGREGRFTFGHVFHLCISGGWIISRATAGRSKQAQPRSPWLIERKLCTPRHLGISPRRDGRGP
jgi:hypothetical protein